MDRDKERIPAADPSELPRLQHEFDEDYQSLVDAINSGGSGYLKYKAPQGYAASVYVEGSDLVSVAYGDEGSGIIHDETTPLICETFWFDIKRKEYDNMVFYGSQGKYTNDAARRASILDTDNVIDALPHLKVRIVRL